MPQTIALFLCGDVMTGRGIDQILPHPNSPELYEPYMRSARGYVALAEGETGPLPRAVGADYIWGDALAEFARVRPAARIINLETAITSNAEPWPGKGIHYRMHPANVPAITAARIDCCCLANNHVLDWGYPGLAETLTTLHAAGIRTAGAGDGASTAAAPAVLELGDSRRMLVLACATYDSGVPATWAASHTRAGLYVLEDLSIARVATIRQALDMVRRPGDRVVVSIHWGGNWGYHVPAAQRAFAQRLIDDAAVDIVHGHSSHHPRGIEVYRGRLILYGCGDFLNDYEGIGGHDEYRPDLTLMYFPSIDADSGALHALELVPLRIRHFRLNSVEREAAQWLADMLSREGAGFGTRARVDRAGHLQLQWG